MKKIIFFLFLLSFSTLTYAQQDLLAAQNNKAVLQKTLDSAMCPHYYITKTDAEKILGKAAVLKDSSYKYSAGILRFTFDYIAKRIDTTAAKGRIFFSYEQYNNIEIAKTTYEGIKTENEKSGKLTPAADLGDEGFLVKDAFEQPFLIVRKNNKIFKIRVYAVTTEDSRFELLKVAGRIVKEK